MFRRVFLLSSLATPMIRWFRPWESLASTLAMVEGANAADLYLKAFGWAKGFPQEDLDRLQQAATIAIDDPNVSRLIDQAGPALDAVRAAAGMKTCRWEPEIPTPADLNPSQNENRSFASYSGSRSNLGQSRSTIARGCRLILAMNS